MGECSPPTTCHMSHVACRMSCVTCHNYYYFSKQCGEAYWWRVCNQRGLPRLGIVGLFVTFIFSAMDLPFLTFYNPKCRTFEKFSINGNIPSYQEAVGTS